MGFEELRQLMPALSWDFASNILAGITGSAMTWIIVSARRHFSDRRKFSDYAGWYDHYSIDDQPIPNEHSHISWMGRNVIKIEHSKPGNSWVSFITLNEAVPHVGSGFYQYTVRSDCGVHQIQRDLSRTKIFVLVTNTSHGKGFTAAYVWKRRAQPPDAAVAAAGSTRGTGALSSH